MAEKTQRCSSSGVKEGLQKASPGRKASPWKPLGAWLRLSWKTRVRVQRKRKSRAHVGLERGCQKEEGPPRRAEKWLRGSAGKQFLVLESGWKGKVAGATETCAASQVSSGQWLWSLSVVLWGNES